MQAKICYLQQIFINCYGNGVMTELIIIFVWLERIALSDCDYFGLIVSGSLIFFSLFEYSKPQQVYRDKLRCKEQQLTPIDGKV